MIFRNASYAYAVLAKNPKQKSAYDAKYNTNFYLNIIGEVGNEVIRPLAMDVAIPLLNLTMQSIGSFAVPLFRDAFEQSSVAFQAAFDSNSTFTFEDMYDMEAELNGESFTSFSYGDDPTASALARARQALEKKKYEQTLRSLNAKLERNKKNMEFAFKQLNETLSSENILRESLDEILAAEQQASVRFEESQR